MGCHSNHRGNDPGLGHLSRGGICATRGPAPHAGAAALGDRRPDRHRRRADLRRTGNDVSEPGGQYQYLKQAFGPLWGFLFGWTSFLAIQAGANAYLGVAFGEYLGAFIPFFSSTHTIASIPVGPWTWEPNTAQLAGVSAIAVLSTVNYFGTKQGARVQGGLTAIKLLSVAGLIGFGLLAPANVSPDWTAPLPAGNLLTAMGLARGGPRQLDGWYQATLSAGEIKRPERNLPLGMIGGTALIGVVYARELGVPPAMPLSEIGASAGSAKRPRPRCSVQRPAGCWRRRFSSRCSAASRRRSSARRGSASRLRTRRHLDISIHLYKTPTAGIVTLGVWSMLLVLSGATSNCFYRCSPASSFT